MDQVLQLHESMLYMRMGFPFLDEFIIVFREFSLTVDVIA